MWKEYIKHYESNKKFVSFFKNYLHEKDQDFLLKNFTIWNGEEKEFTIVSLERIAKVLYQLRSDFVHNAEYAPIPGGDLSGIYFSAKSKCIYFKNDLTMDTILKIFEKGLIEYFKKKIYNYAP